MWQTYINVDTLHNALILLDKYRERCKLLAGGTDLMLELEAGKHSDLDIILDISRVSGLDTIHLDTEGRLNLGALVTHGQCVGSKLLREAGFPLAQASLQVGSAQIRNRGTVVGNIVTGSPANDTIAPLMALNAQVEISSLRGTRTVALSEFYPAFRTTILQPDEMVTGISFNALRSNQRGVFKKFGLRKAQAIAVINLAIVLSFEQDMVTEARVAVGSAAPVVFRARDVEAYLLGKTLTDEVIRVAAEMVGQAASPIGDLRSTKEYRQHLIATLAEDALRELAAGTEQDGYPPEPVLLAGKKPMTAKPLEKSFTVCGDTAIDLTLNGRQKTIRGDTEKTLLHFLRENGQLTGSKDGCSEGECGACTVYLDGKAVLACLVPAGRAHQATVETIESIGSESNLHRVQQAFIDEGAVQCGYCTPGFIMSAVKLLEEAPHPTTDQIKQAIAGNLCRCTGYYKIISAIEKASKVEA